MDSVWEAKKAER
jgi:hypothetical protein